MSDTKSHECPNDPNILRAKLAAVSLVLDGLTKWGPYSNEDGECSFCAVGVDDDGPPDDPAKHQDTCYWAQARKLLALEAKP